MKIPSCLYSIAILFMILSGCYFANNKSTLGYIKKVTSIRLPDNLNIISEFDQSEFATGGKYRLEKKDIKPFLNNNPFVDIDRQYKYLFHFNQYNKTEQSRLSDSAYLKYFSGCKQGNAWLFTLHVNTGELWIEVQYPDFGGQGPRCN
jgi:hypothetical protein